MSAGGREVTRADKLSRLSPAVEMPVVPPVRTKRRVCFLLARRLVCQPDEFF